MAVRGIRGAITVVEDDPDLVVGAAARLLREILRRNELGPDDLISAVFTATEDLTSAFPARAAREIGLERLPALSAREIPVPGALPRVVRVLVHAEVDRAGDEIAHVYLEDATSLREDLA